MKLCEISGIKLPDKSLDFYAVIKTDLGKLSAASVIINKMSNDPDLKNNKNIIVIAKDLIKGNSQNCTINDINRIGKEGFEDSYHFHNCVLSQYSDLNRIFTKMSKKEWQAFVVSFKNQLLNKL